MPNVKVSNSDNFSNSSGIFPDIFHARASSSVSKVRLQKEDVSTKGLWFSSGSARKLLSGSFPFSMFSSLTASQSFQVGLTQLFPP